MALIVDIKVIPQAGKVGFIFDKGGNLKCYLKSPPEKGLANKELIKTIAQKLKVSQDTIELIAGYSSRNKRIKIAKDITLHQLLQALGLELQQKLF